ncbi:MAG TPA: hypothetical protein PKC24_01420 [Cyclobacteriaceae bacterium]|nr:hypothetical protein [Cyclobacteriaceae bacterium]
MSEKEVSFSFNARYYQAAELNAETRQLWIVLHGYGQLAQYFIRKFSVLEKHQICVIAPEGLSRFYLEGFYGRVGATWMTKEDRLRDISNYIKYLNALYQELVLLNKKLPPVTLLGFSQGSATVTRWLMDKQVQFERLILWAGIFPPDLDFNLGSEYLANKKIQFVYGENDPFLTAEKIKEYKELCKKLNIQPELIPFTGAHDIDSETLLKLI